ncbi:ArsR/SmtB family transcription factor [Candidatus Nitrosopumilus sediminis]|uniref:ArsR family transcriptional regulator n=1 Tax=Candidatus Nitrosopumilus sediminis TaxID=1229909 RepID=K0BE27_9ARCH|nr:winged helix-turn-helix domain-containing protein [Candidatus Nitrosopumilus sediminis]AFS82596.1 ArsR family transcriptional regulator [Candidatus Nitrosopumilus sediminis]
MSDEDEDIEIISTEDDKIKLIGEIFSNDSSRKILKLVSNGNEMTANEIAQENNMSLTLTIHHLKRMQAAGMIKVSKTGISAKGQEMKYYVSTNQSFLITSEKSTSSLVNSLKKFSKFAAIGMAGIVSWLTVKPNNQLMPVLEQSESIEEKSSKIVANEWSSASEKITNSDADMTVSSSPELEPIHEPEPHPEPEPSSSGIDEFAFQLSEDRANTGSVSLDRTVYPQPFDGTNATSGDPTLELIISIAVPVAVVAGGIILERILSRWYNKRKLQKKLRGKNS